jgi:hypothetical protein
MTEASFLIGHQWVLLLLGSVVVPGRTVSAVRTAKEVAVKRWTVFASDGTIRR